MNVQVSPNHWSCIPTSFAIILDMPVREVFEKVGHDGSEMIFEGKHEPYGRRSFHPQEFIDLCLERGYVFFPVEAMPLTAGPADLEYFPVPFKEGYGARLARFMSWFPGIVIGEHKGGIPHAMAWDMRQFYDPGSGKVFEDTDFNIREFFAFYKKGER
jgi:hypothetical protein